MYHLNIRQAREALSLTLEDVKNLTGIPVSTLSKIERGKHNPTLDTLNKIAKAMPSEANRLIYWQK